MDLKFENGVLNFLQVIFNFLKDSLLIMIMIMSRNDENGLVKASMNIKYLFQDG